jgi:uncharacterized protein YdhG (YjbR/CyaY superfamily)
MMQKSITTVDDYIASFPDDVQDRLKKIREIIGLKAPDAEESISYAMPAYKLNGKQLVYFAAFKNHVGFYATPTGHAKFADELSKYKQGKGSVQLPFGQQLPVDLIERIVEFRVNENYAKFRKI